MAFTARAQLFVDWCQHGIYRLDFPTECATDCFIGHSPRKVLLILYYTTMHFKRIYVVDSHKSPLRTNLAGNAALMIGLALLPSPLIVSIATLMITPTTFAFDKIFRKSQTEDLGWMKVAGGCVILLAFAGVIARDWFLLSGRKV